MAVLLLREYGWQKTLWFLLAIGLTLTIADQLAASVLKPWFGRLRPCVEPDLADQGRFLVGCGGKFSFPSNHATNHFALAALLSITWLKDKAWGWRWGIFLWAATISLAQVYVGKHYPSDILAGAVLGSAIAGTVVYLYRRFLPEEKQL